MKFIRNALIGIAIYEAAKYLWSRRTSIFAIDKSPDYYTRPHARIRKEETDGLTSDSHTLHGQNADDLLETGSNPNAALTGQKAGPDKNDPWNNSLADDELRAPDS